MAELNVQPKKKTSILPWVLLLLGIIALILYFTKCRHNTATDDVVKDTTSNTVATTSPTNSSHGADWNDIDFNAPSVSYEEITDKNINVRGNNQYGIYGLGENILFDEGKATIRPDAEANLKQIAGSISKRYKNGVIRVYGYTDSKGDADANKQLAQQRADAVKTWLASNGNEADHVSANAIGEDKPVASNQTEAGRQQNRRVEIVARAASE